MTDPNPDAVDCVDVQRRLAQVTMERDRLADEVYRLQGEVEFLNGEIRSAGREMDSMAERYEHELRARERGWD